MPLIEHTQECLDAANHKWPAATKDPADRGRERPKSIPMFKNAFIENVLAKAHPITPGIWFGPVIAYGLYRGLRAGGNGVLGTLGLFAAGWLVWTLIEYTLHRFVFHWKPKNPAHNLQAFLLHGYHHEFPDDGYRLVLPPLMSWPSAIIISTAYYFLVGSHAWATLFAGTVAGYLAYDWIHYYTHHGRPRGGIGKWLRRYHMVHHFRDGSTGFGVSSPLWDLVFGTYQKT